MSGTNKVKASASIALLETPHYEVRKAVEQLYAVFAPYPLPRQLTASHMRDGDAILMILSSRPLVSLSEDDIGAYANFALTTVGSDRDYRHFLPRILELSLRSKGDQGLSPALIGGKLAYCGWRTWPPAEIACVESFFAAAWAFLLTLPPGRTEIFLWLIGMVRGDMNVTEALRAWEAAKSAWAWLHLAEFVLGLPKHFHHTGLLAGGFWNDIDAHRVEEISLWLRSPALTENLFRIGVEGEWIEETHSEQLALAADSLERLRAQLSR